MSIEAMQQALKILENGTIALPGWVPDYDDAIASLRAALAEQAQPRTADANAKTMTACPHGVPHRWPCDECDA